jgi:hypothetical protein
MASLSKIAAVAATIVAVAQAAPVEAAHTAFKESVISAESSNWSETATWHVQGGRQVTATYIDPEEATGTRVDDIPTSTEVPTTTTVGKETSTSTSSASHDIPLWLSSIIPTSREEQMVTTYVRTVRTVLTTSTEESTSTTVANESSTSTSSISHDMPIRLSSILPTSVMEPLFTILPIVVTTTGSGEPMFTTQAIVNISTSIEGIVTTVAEQPTTTKTTLPGWLSSFTTITKRAAITPTTSENLPLWLSSIIPVPEQTTATSSREEQTTATNITRGVNTYARNVPTTSTVESSSTAVTKTSTLTASQDLPLWLSCIISSSMMEPMVSILPIVVTTTMPARK